MTLMEKYLLCGEFMKLPRGGRAYKGRRRGTLEFVGIQEHSRAVKDDVANAVRLMHSFEHPNVLTFLEWYETSKHIWVITELANGGTLADILDLDGYLPFPLVCDFLADVTSGLNYLHSQQIVYCDLQPCKVVLDCCQSLKLCDFTLAQLVGEKRISQSQLLQAAREFFQHRQTSSLADEPESDLMSSHEFPPVPECAPVGLCPYYVAPEVFSGGLFSFSSDLWSLGCLLFELSTGKKPFPGSTTDELIQRVQHSPPVATSIHVLQSNVEREVEPGHLVHLISQLLHKSPQQRLSWEGLLGSPVLHMHAGTH